MIAVKKKNAKWLSARCNVSIQQACTTINVRKKRQNQKLPINLTLSCETVPNAARNQLVTIPSTVVVHAGCTALFPRCINV